MSPAADLLYAELGRAVEGVLSSMAPGIRDAYLLIEEEGLTYAAAAARLKVTIGAVQSRVRRVRAALREQLADFREERQVPLPAAAAKKGTRGRLLLISTSDVAEVAEEVNDAPVRPDIGGVRADVRIDRAG